MSLSVLGTSLHIMKFCANGIRMKSPALTRTSPPFWSMRTRSVVLATNSPAARYLEQEGERLHPIEDSSFIYFRGVDFSAFYTDYRIGKLGGPFQVRTEDGWVEAVALHQPRRQAVGYLLAAGLRLGDQRQQPPQRDQPRVETVFAFRPETNPNAQRDFNMVYSYYFLTNKGFDGPARHIEPSDGEPSWDTTQYPDGDYVITVTATDGKGHTARAQERVTVRNR